MPVLLERFLRGAECLRAARKPPPNLLHVGDLLIFHLDQRTRGTSAALPHRLLVRRDVESNEQNQVTRQDAHASEGGKLLASADTSRRQPWEVARREVGVRGEVDEAEIDDELDDLQHRDVFLPPDTDAARGLEVVPVHYHVHGQVESDGDPGDGGVAEQLGEAEESCGAVMVGVQEGERLFLQEEEDGVQELEVFGEVVELHRGSVSCCFWGLEQG